MWEPARKPIPLKFQILKFIAEQGIVSIEDINRHFYPDRDNSRSIRVTLYDMGVAHLRYCSPAIKNGVWYIGKQELYDLVGIWFCELAYFKVQPPLVHLIPHSLELNHIRTVLEKDSGMTIDEWCSESYMRSLPDSGLRNDFSYPKFPDAVFWRQRKDGVRQKMFLEYERSLKSPERYKEILRNYRERDDVRERNVIYICQTPYIRRKIKAIAQRVLDADRYFQFLSLEGFYEWGAKKKQEAKITDNQAAVAA